MSAQHSARTHIKCVMHGACRMMLGNVERFEVVIVVFDLRTLGDFVTGSGEYLRDAINSDCDRVQAASILASPRKSDVDGFTGQFICQPGCYQLLLARLDCLLHFTFGNVDTLTGRRSFFCWQLAERFELCGEYTLFAKILDTQRIQ